jgi:hypothetical protein
MNDLPTTMPTGDLESDPEVTMVMSLIAQIAFNSGVRSIKDLPGLWHHEFGDGWVIETNGHEAPLPYDNVMIPPFHTLALRHGFPVMICGPFEGTVIGEGSEVELVQALGQELSRVIRREGIVPA